MCRAGGYSEDLSLLCDMPIIQIKVIPGAKKNQVKQENGQMKVYLTAPPVDGKANEALAVYLAEYYGVKKSGVTIIKGLKTRMKTVRIDGI